MCDRSGQFSHRCNAIDVPQLRLRLKQCFRRPHELVGSLDDTLFEPTVELLDFGFGSLQRGGLDNLPIPVSPCEDKLVGTDHIQDFGSATPRKRVRAQHVRRRLPITSFRPSS